MSRIDLSAVLLVLQGTRVAGISGSEASNQVQSKSQITSPLQTGGKGGECMEGVGRGVWWMLPALSGFLLGSEQLTPGTLLDSQRACGLLLIKISHLILQNHELHL